jgi:hypothetical protein
MIVKRKKYLLQILVKVEGGYNTTYRKENVFTAKVRSQVCFSNDTTAPTVSMVNPLKADG